jgi:hypothetical protein
MEFMFLYDVMVEQQEKRRTKKEEEAFALMRERRDR